MTAAILDVGPYRCLQMCNPKFLFISYPNKSNQSLSQFGHSIPTENTSQSTLSLLLEKQQLAKVCHQCIRGLHTTMISLCKNSYINNQNTVIQLGYFNYKYETNDDINGYIIHNTEIVHNQYLPYTNHFVETTSN